MNISKGHIYIIFCHINPKIYYIGSTFNELKQRWSIHKTHFKSKPKTFCSVYKYFDEYEIDNFSLKLLKSYDVYREHSKDNKHLKAYEQLWINKLRDCCNANNPFNILWKEQKKEYYENNKEKIAKYYENNKEKIAEKNKEYNKKNKEKIKKQTKKYYENNKEKIAKKTKQYCEKNKEKVKCECGSIVIKRQFGSHLKTKKHVNNVT